MQPSDIVGELAVPFRQGKAIPLAIGGLPSPESILTIHFVIEIVRRTQGQARAIPLNTGQDGEKLADASLEDPMIPFFDTPDREAREALLATGSTVVMVAGDFVETARYCMVARDLDLLQAARFVSQSVSCLAGLDEQGQVHWVTLDKTADLADLIDGVAGWLGIQRSSWQAARQQMLADYGAWPTVEAAMHHFVQFADPSADGWDDMPDTIDPVLAVLGAYYRCGEIDSIFWPAECLLDAVDPAAPVTETMQLAGPARMLTFGPFMHLPPGRWTARYQFEVDAHPVGNLMEFDVLNGGDILVTRSAMISSGGQFGIDCTFDVRESRLPIEYRARISEGSIGGSFKPIGIWLTREETPPTPQDLG